MMKPSTYWYKKYLAQRFLVNDLTLQVKKLTEIVKTQNEQIEELATHDPTHWARNHPYNLVP
jgi:hypothetical protein